MATHRPNNGPFFDPETPAGAAPKEAPKETPKADPPDPFVFETTYDGELVKLTKEQLASFVNKGIKTAIAEREKKEPEPASPAADPLAPPKSEAELLKEEVHTLRAEIREEKNAALNREIQKAVKKSGLPEVLQSKLELDIMSQILINQHEKKKILPEDVIEEKVKDWNERLAKVLPKGINAEKKIETAEKLKLAGGGTATPTQSSNPPLTRHDFRSGKLSKQIRERLKGALGE